MVKFLDLRRDSTDNLQSSRAVSNDRDTLFRGGVVGARVPVGGVDDGALEGVKEALDVGVLGTAVNRNKRLA